MFKNTKEQYGSVSKFFHWSGALLVLSVLGIALWMEFIAPPGPDKFVLYKWHKQLGVLVLGLVTLRILWRVFNVSPRALQGGLLSIFAKTVHVLLYAFMVALPLSGWGMSSAKGYPVNFFDIYTLPPLVEKNKELGDVFSLVHEVVGYSLLVLVVLHLLGALKHAFIDKDATLRRILP